MIFEDFMLDGVYNTQEKYDSKSTSAWHRIHKLCMRNLNEIKLISVDELFPNPNPDVVESAKPSKILAQPKYDSFVPDRVPLKPFTSSNISATVSGSIYQRKTKSVIQNVARNAFSMVSETADMDITESENTEPILQHEVRGIPKILGGSSQAKSVPETPKLTRKDYKSLPGTDDFILAVSSIICRIPMGKKLIGDSQESTVKHAFGNHKIWLSSINGICTH